MSNLVKIILVVAFAIFVVGFIWAIVAAIKRGDDVAKTPSDSAPAIEQPAPRLNPTPEQPAAVTPTNNDDKGAPPKPQPRRATTVRQGQPSASHERQDVHTDAGNAWASAGIDEFGNAYAEAYAF
jgi:hypothetical protein